MVFHGRREKVLRILALLFLASALVSLSARAHDAAPLVVCVPLDYPPYSFLDEEGRAVGYNVDLTRAVARVMNLHVEIRIQPFGEIRQALEQGQIDAIAGMYYSLDRDRSVDFTPSYTSTHHAIFVHQGSPEIKTEEDLRGKDIIVMRGDIMHDYVLANGLSDDPVTVDTQADALRLLAQGQHDCALIAKLPGYYWMKELGLPGLNTTGPLLNPSNYCFAVQEGNARLQGLFAEGLAILASTGQEQAIYDKWLGALEPKGIPRTKVLKFVIAVGGPVFLLLAVTLLGAAWLRKQVTVRTFDLQERTKELECVYSVAEAIIQLETVDELLQRSVELIPAGWQHPELARARVVFDGKVFAADDFEATAWYQSSEIHLEGTRRGSVEVHYGADRPFLDAEENLLRAITQLLSRAIHGKFVEGRFLSERANYRRLFQEMMNGFAVHRIICDDQGKPVNYKFLDVNPAFERMTGMKAEKVIGRTVRELMPNIEQSWIDRYGKVALTGEPTFFQSYTRELDKSFEVAVFQPAPNQFACLFEDVTQRLVYEESLARQRTRLQSLAAQMANTEDLLRQDIAAGLHDSIGQDLAALKLTVDMMRKQKDPATMLQGNAITTTLDDISGALDGVVQKIWNLAFQLSPPGLYEAGLVPALEWLVEQFNDQHEVEFSLTIRDQPPELEKKVRGLLFQTTRELLINAVKHGAPTRVSVELSVQDDDFQAVITDDGRGFDALTALAPNEAKGGFGLFSIRERLAFLGGGLEIESRPGTGARIVIRLPLSQVENKKAEMSHE